MKKNTQELKTNNAVMSVSDFASALQIPVWKNPLLLPDAEVNSRMELLEWEKKWLFTWSGKEKVQVFLSPESQWDEIFQKIPFFFEDFEFYICTSDLIKERLAGKQNTPGQDTDSNQVAVFLNDLIEKAVHQKATDIHIESLKNCLRIRIRVHGQLISLQNQSDPPRGLINRIKMISGMDISVTRRPQDGHMLFESFRKESFDIRVSSIFGVYGEKIVLRLLPGEKGVRTLSELGISKWDIDRLQDYLNLKQGWILLSGATGSGKTTTLYAMLKELEENPVNIVTIEDPVEYHLDSITQVQVNEKAGVSFSSTLRSLLRQDPDVILIGEIRDSETAEIAAHAAQTGHLVLSSVHASSVSETIQRLKSLNISREDLAASLKLIIHQELVLKKCNCSNVKQCLECSGTGVLGRFPSMKIISVDESIKKQILNHSMSLAAES